ncbi:cilia and flagella associated 54 [Columba livia]|uniref:Cilia and flagella associated 54 n=1 Tax=Columba livia TaxID=8932 RepID=A0A2I0LUL1_COLLI|nr:cilia and flagella associated 54 [Columba livia]
MVFVSAKLKTDRSQIYGFKDGQKGVERRGNKRSGTGAKIWHREHEDYEKGHMKMEVVYIVDVEDKTKIPVPAQINCILEFCVHWQLAVRTAFKVVMAAFEMSLGECDYAKQALRANTLFNIWVKYKPRLPEWYYNEKLLKVGDSLAQIKEYKLALLQCYGRYLQQFVSVNLDDIVNDVHQFKSTFFPNGIRDKNAAHTFHALQERNVCIYQLVCSSDRNLQNQESLQTCFNVLSSLRVTMQVALPQESLCWLIYNGTIHIYTICRHLMMRGQSAKVLEYLLWASICMESSIPLLSVHYLTWRATLYTAVSQCYFDCQVGIHGEMFARRGLIKIDELKQLENISSSLENSERKKIFREATLKMSVMIFKRAVYESRRKPKSSFRPKLRVSLKEIQNLSWPRTTTERLLTEMFDGAAAQFLAILEALSDSSRHVLRPAPPVPDETEIHDVISELFLAGLEILSGERGVSGDAAVKFIKLAFSYEEWDVFDSAIEFVVNFLQAQDDLKWKKAEVELKLLTLVQPILFPSKLKHGLSISESNTKEASMSHDCEKRQTSRKDSLKHGEPSHDLMILATTVFSCVCTSKQNIHPDKEILVDIIVFLWQKCKTGLQRIQMCGSDYLKSMHKHKAYQWVRVLWIINEVIHKSTIADTDAVMLAEVTLHLTAILENIADSTRKINAPLSQDETCDIPEILMKSPTEQLQVAYESLENAINGMNTCRLMTLLPDGKSIFDSCCTKVDSTDQNLNSVLGCGNDKTGTGDGFVMDLHLELIQAQHRVAVKLLKMTQVTEALIMRKIKKNKLSRAIYLMQKATQKFPEELTTSSQKKLLEEALTLIEQVEAEQSALYHSLREAMSSNKTRGTPPPPLLLSRSHCSMTFKPATFSSDIQVSWYSILGCVAEGSNVKVRLNNNKLRNAGEEIPADGKSLLEIQGLDPNEKYIFAVAAYSSDGKLIGDAIGEATQPILAYPPLSVTAVRAYLTQAAYQTGNYTLAREAFSPMWDYFVSSPLPTNAGVVSASINLTTCENRLCFEAVSQTSPITLHLFLRSLFAVCDINVMERGLFCDSIFSSEILYKEQVARLAECERMAVAIELSNWLNDASYTLQSVVQCYGLLAPIIYHKISSVPVVQILIKCLAVLQEIPSATLQRKHVGCYESVQHMIACTSFYTAKVLRSWKEYELAVIIVNYGKKLLDSSPAASPDQSGAMKTEETHTKKEVKVDFILFTIAAHHNGFGLVIDAGRGPGLTGREDPLFLYPVITCWTSNNAYREVMKFKNKPRFLEFFVQVLYKILNEEMFQCVLEWADNVQVYLKRRNDHLLSIGGISTEETSSPTLSEGMARSARGAVGFQKHVETPPLKKSEASTVKKPKKEVLSRKKNPLRQYLMKHPEVMESPEAKSYLNRKKFHQICLEEMPWKSQMNIYLAIAHYNLFRKKLEEQYKVGICVSEHLESYNILDPYVYSLNNAGTVVLRESEEKDIGTPSLHLLKKPGTTKKETCKDKSSDRSTKLRGTDTPPTQTTETLVSRSPKEYHQFPPNTVLLEHFTKILLHLRRAVVLAHRGGHWTLLQNACRELWNYARDFQYIANLLRSHTDAFPITRNFLRKTLWLPFYLASDMIIDMINELQASRSLKIVDPEGVFCIPSCLGGITDENGGSNLHPQSPVDDVNVVDLKWTCKLIFRTIALLYQMKKWEALVHIAVQFNIFTHERYTEQVGPLLVYAQRQLLERIQQFSDPYSHESHFMKYLSDNAEKDLKECGGKAGFEVPNRFVLKTNMTCRNYIGQKLLMPVAPSASEQCFHGCFFYPEMKNDDADCCQAKALAYVPLDVKDTLKCFRETLQKSKYHSRALRHSRKLLSLFLAYTQEILEIYKQRDLKVQALHELGNLHFYTGNKRAAFKYWCQALDETLNVADALKNWREFSFPKNPRDCFAVGRLADISQKFLSQAGIWGCLLAAVLVAKIAQYITTSNMRLRAKYCYFSAILFKTLFRASLPHPTSDCDFAQYETNTLVPGIDLFSDHFRADICTVVASLNFLMFELHCTKQNLIILPLLTLYQYLVSEVCKEPAKCIEGRILKIKVLTDIGFFTEAFNELSSLNCGERIPWKIPAGYRKIEQTKALQKFDSSKSLLTVTNLQVLEDVFNESLSSTMVPLCNQQIMNRLTLAKMNLIICLSATINNIPEKVGKRIYSVDNNSLKGQSRITASKVKADAGKDSRQQGQRGTMVQLVDCKDELNMAMLKGILLTEAEESLSHLVQNIQDKYNGETSLCSAEDLETLVEAKLQLAAISQQRHHAAFSVALAFSAIRILQNAKILRMEMTPFQEKKNARKRLDSHVEDVQPLRSVTAQDHMNLHLWLRCRTMLVTALVTQIQGVGDMEENDVAEHRNVIKEVILEAEAFGDIESQAEMMMQAAILDLQEKRPVAGIKLLLQNIISLLQEDTFISPPASLTLVRSMLLLADILTLQTVEDTEHCSSTAEPLNLLVLAHELTIEAIFVCGEPIERQIEDSTLTCLVLPTKNIYLPHINLLAQVKMRIGHALAEKVACTPGRGDALQRLHALKHLESALKLCRASATKKIDMEAELLFQIGKVERQITEAGNNKSSQAVETLLEAIKLSQQHDQKFELIRRSYLEIALLYLHLARNNEDVSQTDKMVPSKSNITPEEALKSEGYKVQAWIAVRAATQVSEAVLASQLLIGMKSVKEHSMKDAVQQKIPEFASMDLLASYRDFLSDGDNVVSDSPEASSTENKQIMQDEQSQSEGTETLATKASQKKEAVTWVHLIHYHGYLKRLYNMSFLFDAPNSGPGSYSARAGHFSSVFDTGIVLRIAEMHSFLKKHLLEYSTCCLENFPEELHDVELLHSRPTDSLQMSLEITGTTPKMSCVRRASPVSVTVEADRQMENRAANASNKEINIQWYLPSLAGPSNTSETKVLLLYAYNTKPIKISNIKIFSSMSMFSGHLWIPLARIISLREELSNLKQQVEMLMQNSKSLSSASEPMSFLGQSETSKIILSKKPKMNAAKVHLDEKTEIPFDVTLQSIASLEDMFDPANGCIITEESLFNWIVSLFR